MIVIEDNNIKRNLFFKIIDKIKRILNYFFLDFIIKLIFYFNKKNLNDINDEDKTTIENIVNQLNEYEINFSNKKIIFFVFYTNSSNNLK